MMLLRKLTSQEEKLLELLIKKAALPTLADNWKEILQVSPMNDGGMGSLRLLLEGINHDQQQFGKEASEHQFKDKDGISVLATLYLDQMGGLFELDIWKVDDSPLIALPEQFEDK